MSQHTTTEAPFLRVEQERLRLLPDGAVSVETEDGSLVLRASRKLQQRFEELLEQRKTGTSSAQETEEYEAICELDHALSWLNRLARKPKNV